MNKTAACYIFDSFQEEMNLVLDGLKSDELELLEENAVGFSTTLSNFAFDGENVFPQLFQTLYNENFYFNDEFRLRVDLLIKKCRSAVDAFGNVAMLLECMKTHYPKAKEGGSIDHSASA